MSFRKSQGIMSLPSNEINEIFFLVHTFDVLFEVVQPRPYLSLVPAGLGSTLVRFGVQVFSMHALLMSIKIVHSCKPLLSSFTMWEVASEWLVVLQFMLSTHLSAKYFNHWAWHALEI
jgi:hypothetical protein